MIVILCGTADTIPSDILAAHIRAARSGRQRLVIVDEGSQIFWQHIEHERDRLIDPAHGNWDIFYDHPEPETLSEATEAIVRRRDTPPHVYNAATCMLAQILWLLKDEPGVGLSDISTQVRGVTYASVAEEARLDLDDPADTRTGWMALSLLQECAGRFPVRSSTLPQVSIRRWLVGPPGSILFIAAGAGREDGACRSVNAIIARIRELETGAGRDVALLTYVPDEQRLPPQACELTTPIFPKNHAAGPQQPAATRGQR